MGVNANNEHGRGWTCSGGGPVLAVPAEFAGLWRGTLPPIGATVPDGWSWGKSGGPVCDYDKACDPEDPLRSEYGGLGWVRLSNQERALILDSEVYTEWLPEGPEAGTILRGGGDANQLPPEENAFRVYGEIPLKDGRIFLFDSAYEGHDDPELIQADDGVAVANLTPGTYIISIATNQKGTDFIRFRKKN